MHDPTKPKGVIVRTEQHLGRAMRLRVRTAECRPQESRALKYRAPTIHVRWRKADS